MDRGRIAQVGTPLDLYHRPASRFVATFIGTPAMNILPAALLPTQAAGASEVGLRPEDLHLAPPDQGLMTGTCTLCERLGEVTVAHVALPDGTAIVAKLPGDSSVSRGDLLHLTASPDRLHRFAADGQTLPTPR
jgi:ABC-type sugar transport system ATPase subunit